MPGGEIIIETQRIGAILRVAAADVANRTEVTFQAPITASPLSIRQLAASKLRAPPSQYLRRTGAIGRPPRIGALYDLQRCSVR
jgi:hypothetical protein